VHRLQEIPADCALSCVMSALGVTTAIVVSAPTDGGARPIEPGTPCMLSRCAQALAHVSALLVVVMFCCRPCDLQTGIDTVATITATITTASGAIANEAVRPRPADGMVERTRTRGR
jgi:hypothetical protein